MMWCKIACQYSLLFIFGSVCWSQSAKLVGPQPICGQFLRRLTQNESPFHENPALIAISRSQLQLSAGRYPHHISRLSQPNDEGRLVETREYNLPSGGYERLLIVKPFKNVGVIGLDLAFEHFGPYSRMDNQGQAISAFPQSNHALGVRYAKRIAPNLAFGIDAKWLRSKEVSMEEPNYKGQLGHGYAYSFGFHQIINSRIDSGVTIGNLSNGLSFDNLNIPRHLETRILVSGRYQIEVDPITLSAEITHQPQFNLGLQFDLTGEIAYRDRVALRLGYLRWAETQQRKFHYLVNGRAENEQDMWHMEGVKLSLIWNIWKVQLTVNYQPYFQLNPMHSYHSTALKGQRFPTFSLRFRATK